MMYKTVSKGRKLYEEVVEQIVGLVREKQLQPGDRLPPERELADDLGVSRTVLREAIKALEQRELVEVRQGSGTFVRHPSLDTIARSVSAIVLMAPTRYFQLMEVRELIEVELAGRLAAQAEPLDLSEMEAAIEAMWQLLDAPQAFSEQDVRFHLAMYRAAGNEVLLTIMQPIIELLMEPMELTYQDNRAGTEKSLKRHEDLLAYIRAGEVEAARQTMQAIIAQGKARLRLALQL